MTSLREKLDQVLLKEYEDDCNTPRDYWRISALGQPFDAYHRRLQSPRDEYDPWDKARSVLIPKLGTGIHDLVNDLVQKTDLEIIFLDHKDNAERFQVRDEELNCVGHPDMGVVIDGVGILYDIKTVNSGAFTHMKKDGGGKIKAYHHHLLQIHKYFDCLSKDPRTQGKITEMRLLYISRDDGRREEIPVPFDPGILGEANAEFKYLNECWERQEPPAPPDIKSFQHKYSDYKNQMPESYQTNPS